MVRIKKILLGVAVIVFIGVFAFSMLTSDIEHIEDTNGAENYKLQQITDENIINMDIGAMNLSKKRVLFQTCLNIHQKNSQALKNSI